MKRFNEKYHILCTLFTHFYYFFLFFIFDFLSFFVNLRKPRPRVRIESKMPKLRAPSRCDSVGIPIFGIHWFADPSDGTSIIAYCGGGGSSRTGVNNKIFVEIFGRNDDNSSDTEPEGEGTDKHEPITLDTDDLGLAVKIVKNPVTNKITLFCVVGKKLNVYSLPEAKLEQEISIGEMANAIAVNGMTDQLALGCDNGSIKVYNIEHDYNVNELPSYVCDEGDGHTKPVCAVDFAPRKNNLLVSSSKDGTARVWKDGHCIGVLKCSVTDPRKPPPKRPQKLVVVKGCAFGDLDGNLIYTVASGKRGDAYLSKWAFDATKKQFECFERTKCSDAPVSAMSMSSDATALALGNSEGAVSLFSLTKWKVTKKWPGVHEFPVTCIAALPYDVRLMDEELTGIRYHALSASADAKLARLTTQRKIPKNKNSRTPSGFPLAEYVNYSVKMTLILWVFLLLAQDAWRKCSQENGIFGKLMCLKDDVIIAPSSRPGISIPPH